MTRESVPSDTMTLYPPPAPIRLRAVYRGPESLLRELSRAVNRGHTTLRADSGLPVGTRLVVVMVAEPLPEPVEVSGTITRCERRAARYVIGLRYDFEAASHRARLAEAVRALRRGTRRPRREARVPLALRVDARGLEAELGNVSRGGCRLELTGARLPPLAPGSRVQLSLSGSRPGTRRALRVEFEVRWAGPAEGRGRRRRVVAGGRFVDLSPGVRERLRAILAFRDFRPRIRIRRVVPGKPAAGRPR